MAPDGQKHVDELSSPLTIHIHPDKKRSFELYDDDTKSNEYEKGNFSITKYTYENTKKGLFILKDKPEISYDLEGRDHIFCIHQFNHAEGVCCNCRSLSKIPSLDELNRTSKGWFVSEGENKTNIKVAEDSMHKILIEIGI